MRQLCFLFVVLFSCSAFAQTCYFDSVKQTTPVAQFIDNHDGTILDARTGLVWMKCSVGQTYQNETCLGEATLFSSWSEALSVASRFSFTTANAAIQYDFRVPNIKELSTLVQRSCFDPAINLTVFSNTPSNTYVTSSPTDPAFRDKPFRYVNFETGLEFTPTVDFFLNMRLVSKQPNAQSGRNSKRIP